MSENHGTQTAVNIGTGIAPLLMLFCLLCMTTFAVLSYVQASAQLKMSDKAVTRMQDIYTQSEQRGENR